MSVERGWLVPWSCRINGAYACYQNVAIWELEPNRVIENLAQQNRPQQEVLRNKPTNSVIIPQTLIVHCFRQYQNWSTENHFITNAGNTPGGRCHVQSRNYNKSTCPESFTFFSATMFTRLFNSFMFALKWGWLATQSTYLLNPPLNHVLLSDKKYRLHSLQTTLL